MKKLLTRRRATIAIFLSVILILLFAPRTTAFADTFTIEADSIEMDNMRITLLDLEKGIWIGAPTKTEADYVVLENVEIYREVDGEKLLIQTFTHGEGADMTLYQPLLDALKLVPDIGIGDVLVASFPLCSVHVYMEDVTIDAKRQELGSLDVQGLKVHR